MSLFKRKYKLTLGKPTIVKQNFPLKSSTLLEGNEYVLESHNISFEISKSNTPSNNEASITVYNTSDTLVSFLEKNAGLDTYIKLEVGYGDEDLKELFLGSISGVTDEFTTTDRKTKIKCGDGYAYTKEQKTSKSYKKGTTFSRIVDDMVEDLGVPKGTFIPPEGETKKPVVYNGVIKEIMTTIAKDIDYDFSIQDGRVDMVPFKYSKGPTVKVISPDSGLIGSPTPMDTSSGQRQENKEDKKAVRVKCLIDPAVRPNSKIKLESRKYNGFFKVNKVDFSGELEGGEWAMTMECVPI